MSHIGLLHADSLLGKEIAGRISGRARASLRLLTTDTEAAGTLVDAGDAVGLLQLADADTLAGLDVLVDAGNDVSCLELPDAAPPRILARPDDIVAGLEIVIPEIGALPPGPLVPGVALQSPWAGTVALARLLKALSPFEPIEVFTTTLEPVTSLGEAGLDELLEQARSMLSFQPEVKTEVLARRMAFNAVPLAGGEGETVAGQLRSALSRASLRLHLTRLRLGIFHGTALAVSVRCAQPPVDGAAVREALSVTPPFCLTEPGALPGIDEIPGRDELLVTLLDEGATDTLAFWLLIDNLVLAGATNTVLALESLLPGLFDQSTH